MCTPAHCVAADELTDYFRLLAVLEAQIAGNNELEPGVHLEPSTLTLRRLVVWTQDPLHRMRLLASLVEAVQGLHGGALASAVHARTAHGDVFVQNLYGRIVQRICMPLFAMIQRWVVAGELADECGEFFVVADPTVPDALLWQNKYHVSEAMLPTFIGKELGQRILLIGKSINFIRQCCGDKEWVMDDAAAVFAGGNLKFGQLQRLKDITKLTYDSANRRLVSILFDKYKLLTHCRALKRYLLLGQGDFVQCLMDGLVKELDKPASQQYHHNLVAVMDSALRQSNAQFEEKDVVDRLDIKVGLCEPAGPIVWRWGAWGTYLWYITPPAHATVRRRPRLGRVCLDIQSRHSDQRGAYPSRDGSLLAHVQLLVAPQACRVQFE